jgi:hypothetical protein
MKNSYVACRPNDTAGKPYWRGRLSTIDLPIKVAWLALKTSILKGTDLSWLVLGGQPYWAIPFSKASLETVRAVLANHCVDQMSVGQRVFNQKTWNREVVTL